MFWAHALREILRYASHAQKNYCIPYRNCQTLFSFCLNLFFRAYLVLSRCATEGRGIRLRIFLNNSSNFFIILYSPPLLLLLLQTLSTPPQETLNTSKASYPTPEVVSSPRITPPVVGNHCADLAVGAIIPFA